MSMNKNFRMFNGKISFLIDLKTLIIFGIFLFLTVFLFVISTGTGELKMSPLAVLKVFFGGGSEMNRLVVQSFRLPRIIVALIVGMALAVAGAILQGMIRNPLASPDVLGITTGASVAVVGFLALFSDKNNALTVSINWLPLAAFIGAVGVTILIYFLSWKKGVSPFRLVLIGIGISYLMQALTTLLIILGPITQASQANMWITGTVYGSKWSSVYIIVPWTLLFILLSLFLSRNVNIQGLGDEMATGVGVSVQRQRLLLLLISTGLVGGAVAFGGGIGFVGLMAPHIARKLVGSSFGSLCAIAALIGGILVMLADLIGRTFFSPLEIPAGVFTAGIGAPYFIYLLYKTRNS